MARLSCGEIINHVINYYKNNSEYKKTNDMAYYTLKNTFYKDHSKYGHVLKLKEIINGCRNKKYSGEDIYMKRFVYKDDNEKTIKCIFNFLQKVEKEIYLVKSTLFTKSDVEILDLIDKVEVMKEKEIPKYFEIIHRENVRSTLKKDLEANKTKEKNSFYVYNFVMVDGNGKVSVSVPFALSCFKQFSKRDKKSVLGKFYRSFKDAHHPVDEILYYINTIYDFENKKFKEKFYFRVSFYSKAEENTQCNYDYPSPVSEGFLDNEENSIELEFPINGLEELKIEQPGTPLSIGSDGCIIEQPESLSLRLDNPLFVNDYIMNVPNTTNISSDPTYPVLSNTLPNQLLMQNPLIGSELVIGKYPVNNQVNQLYPSKTLTTTSPLINPLALSPMYNQVSLVNPLTPPVNSMITSPLLNAMEIPVSIPLSPVDSMTSSPLLNAMEIPVSIPISPVDSMTSSPLLNAMEIPVSIPISPVDSMTSSPLLNPIENPLSPLMIDCGNDQSANMDFLNINLLLQNSETPSTDNNNSIYQSY